jgi:hypothetical protein
MFTSLSFLLIKNNNERLNNYPSMSKQLLWANRYFSYCRRRLHGRGSRFLIFNILQFAIDGKNNSKTKEEKVFFFIFMSSYAEMRFLKQKITK